MLQIVTLHGDCQYQIAHLCIIGSTKDTMGFNIYVVLSSWVTLTSSYIIMNSLHMCFAIFSSVFYSSIILLNYQQMCDFC